MAKNKDNKGKVKSAKKSQVETTTSLVDSNASNRTEGKSKSDTIR